MPPQHLTIKPPLGGVVESTRLEDQPAGTCSYALNCWPSDSEQRARLSARPAIKSFATGGTASPSASPIRMLAEVNYATATETTRYLIASTGGNVYKLSTAAGGWTTIESDLNISGSNPIQAAPFGNKLYIADWEDLSAANSGETGVIGEHEKSGTSGLLVQGYVSDFGESGDDWTETGGTNYEYGYDLSTHAAIVIPPSTTGARFDGVGSLVRSGLALPTDGHTATWSAKLGPWDGDSSILAGIGDGSAAIPSEYGLGYNADTDTVYAYVGGSLVDSVTVSGKKYCLFEIALTNSGGDIEYEMTITDLVADSVLLNYTHAESSTRAYTSSTLSSQVRCDGVGSGRKIFVEEVRYNWGPGGDFAGISGSLTDSSVSDWGLGEGVANYLLVVTSKADHTATAVAGVHEIVGVEDEGRVLHLKGESALAATSSLRWHLIKMGGAGSPALDLNAFVVPANHGWSSAQVNDHVLRVTSGDANREKGFWEVTLASDDKLTIRKSTEQSEPPDDEGTAGFKNLQWCLPRTAKVLDLEATPNTLSRWVPTTGSGVSFGNVPHGSKMIATWQDRMVLGNDQVTPHVWHMSRNGDPYDFKYGEEDLGSAVAGTNFQGGLIGEPLTALISHNKACLLVGGKDSIWVLRGDPMQGGYIERLSDDVGVLGPWAHTKTDKDVTYFLTHLGLYAMPSGCGEVPQPVGEDRLPKTGPKFWRDIDHLGFDGVHNGLIVSTTAAATATPANFWYDLGSGGWWPFSLDGATAKLKEVTALFSWQPAAGRFDSALEIFYRRHRGSLLIGCDNGKVCRLDEASTTDEGGSAIAAVVNIGPINFSPSPSQSAMVQEIKGIGKYGDDISSTQVLYVGATAADALSQATAGDYGYSMTWSDDHNAVTDNPRMSGHSLVLVITGDGDDWAFEEAGLTITPLGRAR